MSRLSTDNTSDLFELLKKFSDEPVLLILVCITPRQERTGLLEEKGEWINRFWEGFINLMKEVTGCRIMWAELFFVVPINETTRVESCLKELLLKLRCDSLKSICVTMEATGNVNDKVEKLDLLGHEISSPHNFNTIDSVKHRFVDGIET
jgi:hypothetical protein